MCIFWIYQYIWYPFMAGRERSQRAKEEKARAKAAQEREERKADPAPYQGLCRRVATAKKNREQQVKNYHARCAAEDAAEKAEKEAAEEQAADRNAAEKGAVEEEGAEKDASGKNVVGENAAEGAAADAADNHDQSASSSSSTAGRSVHFPEATRDAAHDAPREKAAPKKSFREVVGTMTSRLQCFKRNREEGRRERGRREPVQRRNGIQLRNLFKKKYTGPPMEYYM